MCDAHPEPQEDDELQRLITEACSYPPKSFGRRRALSELVSRVSQSGRLWQENTPYYEDILQKIWLYVCQNPEAYDAERGKVVTWINYYLKKRLLDECIKPPPPPQVASDLIGNLPAPQDIPPMLEDVLQWIETDPDEKLRSAVMKSRPDINCQMILLDRFPRPSCISWQEITDKYKLPGVSKAAMFCKRNCWPILRDFGQAQGYLDN
ncbi:MAG: sigma-70 family RNA polymerase sigma factor [Cyanobacteria bacterium P01_A01_bin.114]